MIARNFELFVLIPIFFRELNDYVLKKVSKSRHRHKARNAENGDHADGEWIGAYVDACVQPIQNGNDSKTRKAVYNDPPEYPRLLCAYGCDEDGKNGRSHADVKRVHGKYLLKTEGFPGFMYEGFKIRMFFSSE